MMNDNVGDMPIDIFGDYISDCLGEEWTWEYLTTNLNYYPYFDDMGDSWTNAIFGNGMEGTSFGNGVEYSDYENYAVGDNNMGMGHSLGNGHTSEKW